MESPCLTCGKATRPAERHNQSPPPPEQVVPLCPVGKTVKTSLPEMVPDTINLRLHALASSQDAGWLHDHWQHRKLSVATNATNTYFTPFFLSDWPQVLWDKQVNVLDLT